MSKFVMVVLPDEKKAYEGYHAMQRLHEDGTLTVYGAEVVERKPDGKLAIKQAADQGPMGLAVGTLVGGLAGLFGGPVGAAVGLAGGGLLGSWRDYVHAGVGDEYVETIASELAPGKFAVFAEVEEDWVTPLDTRMEALGGKVVREYRDEFVDDLIEKRVDAVKSDLDQRKVEHESAKAKKMESKLDKRIAEARQDLQKTAQKARQRLDEKKQEMNAKVNALKAQAQKATPEVKRRIDQRMDEIRKELAAREEKLNHAFEMANEALSP